MKNSLLSEQFKSQTQIINDVLHYFSEKINESDFLIIEKNARHALSDSHLYEVFEMWVNREISNEGFIYQLKEYQNAAPLPESKGNFSNNKSEMEKLKNLIDLNFSSRFGKILLTLASKKGLDTNEKLGAFLGVSSEQARVLCKGDHKPQRKTLLKIAEKFEVPMEYFLDH